MDAELPGKLDSLGFRRGRIAEIILVTLNPDGSPNAAPMGVRRSGDAAFDVRPFKSSSTYRNLSRNPVSAINVTHDPVVFLATAFKEDALRQPDIDGLRIRGCDALVALERTGGMEALEDRFSFTNQAKDITIYRDTPQVFSRGVAEAIEAVIHATRVKAFTEQGRLTDADMYEKKVGECVSVIRRVSGQGTPEATVAETLEELLTTWRAER